MTVVLVDLVKVVASSTGTGPFVLGAAVPGFRGIEALADGIEYRYSTQPNSQYEVGTGTFTAIGALLARDVSISSNGNDAINLPANSEITFTALASDYGSPGGSLQAGNNLSDVQSAALSRQNLALVPGTNIQAHSALLDTLAVHMTNFSLGLVQLGDATSWRSALGVGSGVGDLLAANNLADVDSASLSRDHLGLTIGTNVQAYDADLAALAALTGTNTIYYRSAANTWTPVTIGGNMTFTGGTLDSTGGGGGGTAWGLTFKPMDSEAPTSNYAILSQRNNHPLLSFDDTTQWATMFTGVLPDGYGGNGVTVSVWCALASAITGTVGWDVAFERDDAGGLDIDGDSFATAQTITAVTVPGTSGLLLKMSVNIADGADMDSLAAGEMFRLRVRRDVANDTAVGNAQLLAVHVVEQ